VLVRTNFATSPSGKSEVISLFVGKKDADTTLETLKKSAFPDCEIVMKSLRKGNPEEWNKKLQIHNALSDHSRAIKIYEVTESLREKLGQLIAADAEAYTKVIDIARVGFEGSDNVLYIQCHGAHKTWLTDWINIRLPTIHPDVQGRPYIHEHSQTSKVIKKINIKRSWKKRHL
jgi:hypothetical protein